MIGRFPGLAMVLVMAFPLMGVAQPVPPWPPPFPATPFTLHPAAPPTPALKYQLLPEEMDKKPGNAVPLYYRAFSPEWWGNIQRQKDLYENVNKWKQTSLSELRLSFPKEKVLPFPRSMLEEIDLASRREYCDWEFTPRLRIDMLLPDQQSFRTVANFLALRARLELAQSNYEKAVYSLQTGLALAKNLGEAPILISDLVGIAIAHIMLEQIETLVQQPDAPNLYWALTDLPRPLVNLRKGFQGERLWLYNQFPDLKDLESITFSPQQLQILRNQMITSMKWLGENQPTWQDELDLLTLVIKAYPIARRSLIADGRQPAEVEAMPAFQVVMIHSMRQYRKHQDEMDKWVNLPYWEARPGMDQAEKELLGAKSYSEEGIPLARLLLPAGQKVLFASARLERRIAALRIVEAIRLYAASHDSNLPGKLDDITEVPIPIDPVAGKSFEYQVDGAKATLIGPPPTGETPSQGNALKYELTMVR